MGLLDRARSLLRSPADRRLDAIARELWQDAPTPSPALSLAASQPPPWSGYPGTPGRTPQIDWMQDQPAPPPDMYRFQAGYSDHTYTQFAAPLGFEAFSLEAIRGAVAQHRIGIFWASSLLTISILGFAPVQAALSQAIAPILDLPRKIRSDTESGPRFIGTKYKGLARLLRDEVIELLVLGDGLQPSAYFPPELWGTMAIYLRMMGFAILQHVDGDPDPDTGVRPRFSRIWEPWAINWYRSPRKVIAQTSEGPVDITNDGKFTIVGDTNEPYLYDAAICSLGEEAFAGKLTQEQRMNWLMFFGQPKLFATLPEKISTKGQAGNAFLAALESIYGPSGRGILPYGTVLDAVALKGEGSKAFQEGIIDAIVHIFMVLTGSAGTIGNGMNTGAGQSYQPAKGGAWGVRQDLVSRPIRAIVQAVNGGYIKPFCDGNYGHAIEEAQARGQWNGYPRLEVPLPDEERDARIASIAAREKMRCDILLARAGVGSPPTQTIADELAEDLEVRPIPIVDSKAGTIYEYHIEQKQVATDEVRQGLGLPPLPNGQGSVEELARERAEGRDKTGVVKQTITEDAAPVADPIEEP